MAFTSASGCIGVYSEQGSWGSFEHGTVYPEPRGFGTYVAITSESFVFVLIVV